MDDMKTLEIPDHLFRRAESAAAERGIPLRDLVSEAIIEKLGPDTAQEKSWMRTFGKLRDLREETARINLIIEEAFEKIEPRGREVILDTNGLSALARGLPRPAR
jgi:hypothetical protein